MGLTDGEQLERLWSYLCRFARMTKEMRPENRLDTLSMAILHYGQRTTYQIGILVFIFIDFLTVLVSTVREQK